MGKIVAIGGGEIGRPGTQVETTGIDLEIVRLTGKRQPKLLFIPTATSDAGSYCDAVKQHFGGRLGCNVEILYLINNPLTQREIEQKVLAAEIIYVGGGDPLKMLTEWRRRGVDELLMRAYENNIILSGLSAGALCWFRYGSAYSQKFVNRQGNPTKIRGLNIINALCYPHYENEGSKKEHLYKLMHKTSGAAIALEDCAAIEIVNEKYRIITTKNTARAYKVHWCKEEFHEEVMEQTENFLPFEKLLEK